MTFLVRWLNYDQSHDSWEPWKNLCATDQLHDCLRRNNMEKVIPKEFLNKPSEVTEEP